jgi:hypothetical protein
MGWHPGRLEPAKPAGRAQVDGRVLTAILYLNPGWDAADGGELRLLPFPFGPVDLAPLFGRVVRCYAGRTRGVYNLCVGTIGCYIVYL